MLLQDMIFFGTGRRKTSVAKVILRLGVGNVLVNGKCFKLYFPSFLKILTINKILQVVDCVDMFNIYITVSGGGLESQYNAICFGLSLALLNYIKLNKKDDFLLSKKSLKDIGFISRDARIVERKKFGFRKARKKKQYSKR